VEFIRPLADRDLRPLQGIYIQGSREVKKMAKSATDIEIRNDNIYCPHCGAVQKKAESFCSHCGKSLYKKDDMQTENSMTESSEKKRKKPFYKKKGFIIFSAVLALGLAAIGTIFYMKSIEGNDFKSKVKSVWGDVAKETDNLNKEVSTMEKIDDFKKVGVKIKTIESIIDDKQETLNKIDAPENYRDGKEALMLGFSNYKSYLQVLRSASDNPSKMTNQDIEEIETLSEDSKTSFSKMHSKLDFLDQKLSDDTYGIVSKFQEVRKNYEEQLATEEQTKADQERQGKQEQEDKAKAESIVTSFMNAYIAGKEADVKKYMTAAFQKEFNYADLSSDARMYSYPESFRITQTKKTSDSQYDVYGRELQVNRESGSKWTIDRHLAVVWVQSESKWLIDRWDIKSE